MDVTPYARNALALRLDTPQEQMAVVLALEARRCALVERASWTADRATANDLFAEAALLDAMIGKLCAAGACGGHGTAGGAPERG